MLSLVCSFANSPEKKKNSVYFSLMTVEMCMGNSISLIWIYYTCPSGTAQEGLLQGPYLGTLTSRLCLPSVPSPLGCATGRCQLSAANSLPSTQHKSLRLRQCCWRHDGFRIKGTNACRNGKYLLFILLIHWVKQPVIRRCCPFTWHHTIPIQNNVLTKKAGISPIRNSDTLLDCVNFREIPSLTSATIFWFQAYYPSLPRHKIL